MPTAKLLSSSTHLITGKLRVTELWFEVPVDYAKPNKGTIRIFARSCSKHVPPICPPSSDAEAKKDSQKPWMVFLQGGPGYGCSTPKSSAITNPILQKGYQILFIDQRGTGLSSTITSQTLSSQGRSTPNSQATYLTHFRADSIVKDLEAIRAILTEDYPPHLKKWSLFGQSFGGFCAFTYLSFSWEGLREVFTSGGIPPIGKSAEEVYRATFRTVIRRNEAFYKKYPEDVRAVHDLLYHIESADAINLPSGGILTPERLLTLGLLFGSQGGIDAVHDLIQRMRSDLELHEFFTRPTLSEFEKMLAYDDAVLYAVLQESIYCEGNASNWAAERVGAEMKDFFWLKGFPKKGSVESKEPFYFSGEMMFRFLYSTHPELKALQPVAQILAEFKSWPKLYDQVQLAKNEVPVYSASFIDDMYVDFGLVHETVAKVKGIKQFLTNTMYHDAVRKHGDGLMAELFNLRDDCLD